MAISRFRVRLLRGVPLRKSGVALRLRVTRPDADEPTASSSSLFPEASLAEASVPEASRNPEEGDARVALTQAPDDVSASVRSPPKFLLPSASPDAEPTDEESTVPSPDDALHALPAQPKEPLPPSEPFSEPAVVPSTEEAVVGSGSFFDPPPADEASDPSVPLPPVAGRSEVVPLADLAESDVANEVPSDAQIETPDPLEADLTDAAEPSRSRLGWRLACGLAFALGLGLGLTVWLFARAQHEQLPKGSELRRLAKESRALRQDLEGERLRVEERWQMATAENHRLRGEWTALDGEILSLKQAHEAAADGAESLKQRLGIFTERYQNLAQDSQSSAELRRQAGALSQEGTFFRAALETEIARLDDKRRQLQARRDRIEERLDADQVRGVSIRVIHDARRLADARKTVELLNQAGAEAEIFEAEVEEPKEHKGRLYFHAASEEGAARRIRFLVQDIEALEVEPIGVKNPFISLWLVGEPTGEALEDWPDEVPDDVQPANS